MDTFSREWQNPNGGKSHEAEDVSSIPPMFFSSRTDMEKETSGTACKPPHLHRARDESRRQGRRPVDVRERKDLHMLSIEARQKSFEEEEESGVSSSASSASPPPRQAEGGKLWEGPCVREMAMAGFRRLSSTRARCCYCGITLRSWRSTDDVWMRHKNFSPHCRRLKQVGDGGIHPSPEGKKQLRHSFSSIHDLKHPA